MFAQPICKDESLIDKAVNARIGDGGCCMPVGGDPTESLCQPMTQGQFKICCRQACATANQKYGCDLNCNNGACTHAVNPFAYPAGDRDGKASFDDCLARYCGPGCNPRTYSYVEPKIYNCCSANCGGDATCLHDCHQKAINYKASGGGPQRAERSPRDQADKASYIKNELVKALEGSGLHWKQLGPVADCIYPILEAKFGTDELVKIADDAFVPTPDEALALNDAFLGCTQPGVAEQRPD